MIGESFLQFGGYRIGETQRGLAVTYKSSRIASMLLRVHDGAQPGALFCFFLVVVIY